MSLKLAFFVQMKSPSSEEIGQLNRSAYCMAVGCSADVILGLQTEWS